VSRFLIANNQPVRIRFYHLSRSFFQKIRSRKSISAFETSTNLLEKFFCADLGFSSFEFHFFDRIFQKERNQRSNSIRKTVCSTGKRIIQCCILKNIDLLSFFSAIMFLIEMHSHRKLCGLVS